MERVEEAQGGYTSYQFRRAVAKVLAGAAARQAWSPAVTQNGVAVTLVSASSQAWYVRLGPIVFFWADLRIDGGGGAGELVVGNLPVAGLTGAQSYAVGAWRYWITAAPNTRFAGTVDMKATGASLEFIEDGVATNFWAATKVAQNDQFSFWGAYLIRA